MRRGNWKHYNSTRIGFPWSCQQALHNIFIKQITSTMATNIDTSLSPPAFSSPRIIVTPSLLIFGLGVAIDRDHQLGVLGPYAGHKFRVDYRVFHNICGSYLKTLVVFSLYIVQRCQLPWLAHHTTSSYKFYGSDGLKMYNLKY